MGKLEETKAALGNASILSDDAEAKSAITAFAMRVFLAADREDQMGMATKVRRSFCWFPAL